MKIIKWLAQGLVTVALMFGAYELMSYNVFAQMTTPSLPSGAYLTPFEAPCISSSTSWAEGTNEVLVRSSFTSISPSSAPVVTGQGISTSVVTTQPAGPGWISWIAMSTGALTDNLIVRDTGTLGNTGNNIQILPPIQFSTYTQIGNGVNFNPTLTILTFTPPIRFNNGITLQMQGTGKGRATVCFRNYNQQTP